EDHAGEADHSEGALEADGKPPGDLVGHSGEAKIHPVSKSHAADEPHTLDGDFGATFFGFDTHLGHKNAVPAAEWHAHTSDDDTHDSSGERVGAGDHRDN
ncbi:MAG: hypothetical protein M1823_009164, partial [Watsoniomyces obsoletus]